MPFIVPFIFVRILCHLSWSWLVSPLLTEKMCTGPSPTVFLILDTQSSILPVAQAQNLIDVCIKHQCCVRNYLRLNDLEQGPSMSAADPQSAHGVSGFSAQRLTRPKPRCYPAALLSRAWGFLPSLFRSLAECSYLWL